MDIYDQDGKPVSRFVDRARGTHGARVYYLKARNSDASTRFPLAKMARTLFRDTCRWMVYHDLESGVRSLVEGQQDDKSRLIREAS